MSTTPNARPIPTVPRSYQFPQVERTRLSNGVSVEVATLTRLPIVTVLALVDGGAALDAPAEGSALLTARALGEGGDGGDGRSLAEAFESLGSGLDAASDWDSTQAQVTVMAERLTSATNMLAVAIMRPELAERDILRLRDERIEELLQVEKEPRALADDVFAGLVYADEARYSRPEGGAQPAVSMLDAGALRAYHGHQFAPDTVTLILCGDVMPDEAFAVAERTLGAWSGSAKRARVMADLQRVNGPRVLIVDKAGAPQSELRIGHRGVPRHHVDYFPLVVMNALLGGLFSSRINLNLRERNGFTYGARSTFDWRRGAGPFMVSTAVKTDVTARAVREVLTEVDRMRVDLVGAEELALATAYLDGVFPIRFETTEAVADAVARARTFDLGTEYYSAYREQVRSVTADDVRRVAHEHLRPDDLRIVAVGDSKVIRVDLEALQLGSVHLHEAS